VAFNQEASSLLDQLGPDRLRESRRSLNFAMSPFWGRLRAASAF
jgi:hypothetical protein